MSYFLLPGTFWYIGIWRSCNFAFYILREVKCKYIITHIIIFILKKKRCSKLAIKKPERRHWSLSGVFIVNFERISHFVIVALLLTLNM